MRVHDCPDRVVNSDHMQISFEAKILPSCYDCCFVEGGLLILTSGGFKYCERSVHKPARLLQFADG